MTQSGTGYQQVYTYDSLKRLQYVDTTLPGLPAGSNTFRITYTYYGDGSVATMTTPVGVTTYNYDSAGRRKHLQDPFGNTTDWTYDHAGRVTSEITTPAIGSPIRTDYAYANTGQTNDTSTAPAYLRTITQTVNGQTFKTFTLTHSYLGQLLDQNQSNFPAGNSHEIFTFDNRGRLATEQDTTSPPGSRVIFGNNGTYQYDLANNLQGGASGWTYNSNNQVTAAPAQGGLPGGTGFAYDYSGNLTGFNSMTLNYDCWGQVTQITGTSSGTVSYTYDPMGHRISKTVGGVTTYFLYAGNALICELNSSGSIQKTYVWGTSGLISDHAGSASTFYLFDAAGNTRNLISADGRSLYYEAYSGWGARYSGNLPGTTAFGWKGRFGQYMDNETGLIYCRQRYYAPAIGRFLSRDPSGFRAGPNLYVFCMDDPVDFFDANGQISDMAEYVISSGADFAESLEDYLPFNFPKPVYMIRGMINGLYDSAYNAGYTQGLYDGGKASPGQLAYAYANYGFHLATTAVAIYGAGKMVSSALGAMTAAEEITGANPGCFTAGHPIATVAPDSLQKTGAHAAKSPASTPRIVFKNNEQIHAGDVVVSRNEQTGKTEFKRVERTTVRTVPLVRTIILVNARTGAEVETLTATREHPFYVRGKGFVPAGGLAVGNAIVTRAGPDLVVKRVEWHRRAEGYQVYNFVVEDNHTYFVGTADGGVWVHNPDIQCGLDLDLPAHPKDVYDRPSGYRVGVREKVWQNAVRDSEDGIVRDPDTLEELEADGDWQMGHKPGFEFKHHVESAIRRGISRDQFMDEFNDPSIYRPETAPTNLSHRLESDISLWP